MAEDEAPKRHPQSTAEEAESSKPNKRPRTILACLACRQKKRRCDGQRPRCQRCVRTSSNCEYSAEFYTISSDQPSTIPIRPAEGDNGGFARPADPRIQEPAVLMDRMAAQDIPFQQLEQLKQLGSSSRTAPTLGPRTQEDGEGSTFRFNPNEWKRGIQSRPSLSLSPNGGPLPSAAGVQRTDSDSYANNFGYPAQQPFPLTEGLPFQTGLDEWTQLFLTQVFMPDGRQVTAPQDLQQPMNPSGQSSYANLQPEHVQLQQQPSAEQSSDQLLKAPQEVISPQMSSGSSKRAAKFRIPYFR